MFYKYLDFFVNLFPFDPHYNDIHHLFLQLLYNQLKRNQLYNFWYNIKFFEIQNLLYVKLNNHKISFHKK